jgi:hypothetical protein
LDHRSRCRHRWRWPAQRALSRQNSAVPTPRPAKSRRAAGVTGAGPAYEPGGPGALSCQSVGNVRIPGPPSPPLALSPDALSGAGELWVIPGFANRLTLLSPSLAAAHSWWARSPVLAARCGRFIGLSRAIGYRSGAARAIVDRDNRVVRSPNGRQEPVSEVPAGGVLPRSGRRGTLPRDGRDPPVESLTVAWTRTGGFRAAAWRAEPRCGLFPEGDDGRGSVGVREPRRPRPPRLGGAVALPLDDEPPGATC